MAEAREPERTAPGGGSGGALVSLIAVLSEADRKQAVTHSSWTARRVDSWGRAAFLGDAVLGLVVGEELYKRYPRSDIGRLTKVHGQAVSGRACAEVALELGVPEMLAARRAERPRAASRSRSCLPASGRWRRSSRP